MRHTTLWSGIIFFTSPLKKLIVVIFLSALISFLVPLQKVMIRRPSVSTSSTFKNIVHLMLLKSKDASYTTLPSNEIGTWSNSLYSFNTFAFQSYLSSICAFFFASLSYERKKVWHYLLAKSSLFMHFDSNSHHTTFSSVKHDKTDCPGAIMQKYRLFIGRLS